MVPIQLNIRVTPGQNDFVPMELNSGGKVKELREEVSKVSKLPSEEILLMFCCGKLKDTESIEEAGITAGDVVLCLRDPNATHANDTLPLTAEETAEIHKGLVRLVKSNDKLIFLKQMTTPKLRTAALNRVPAALEDPSLLYLITDTAMIYSYAQHTNESLGEILSSSPVLGRLLQHVLEVYKKDGPWVAPTTASDSSTVPPPPSAFTLDSLYEQDADDINSRAPARQRRGGRGGQRNDNGAGGSNAAALPVITPAQLAAALANATGGGFGHSHVPSLPPHRGGGHPSLTPYNTPASNTSAGTSASASAPHTPASASASTPQQPAPAITSEMLNSALQSVLGAVYAGGAAGGSSTSRTSPPQAPVIPPVSATPPTAGIPNIEESVRLMAEMGIPDEALSRQALVLTNGDVQAAVELVFAQLNMFD